MLRRALTGKHRHRALIAYLASNNLPQTANALREEIGLGEDVFDAATAKKYEGLLEKKWTSVVRLQKKVGDTGRCAAHVSRASTTI
jgi:platelet-activating factor acetylhydrolase IB subunit alpha